MQTTTTWQPGKTGIFSYSNLLDMYQDLPYIGMLFNVGDRVRIVPRRRQAAWPTITTVIERGRCLKGRAWYIVAYPPGGRWHEFQLEKAE